MNAKPEDESAKPKGRVYGDAAAQRVRTFVSRLNDIYCSARNFKLTHEDIAERVQERVYENPEFKRLGNYERGRIFGYHECLRDKLWLELAWLVSIDGQLMTKEEEKALYAQELAEGKDQQPGYRSPISRVDGELSRHVWVDKGGNPLRDCPFDRKFKTYLVGGVTLSHEEYEKAKKAHT